MAKLNKYRKLLKRAFKEQNKDLLDRTLRESFEALGADQTEELLRDDIFPNLSLEQREWMMDQLPDHLQEDFKEKAKETVTRMLINGGFKLGTDFSVSSGMIAVSDRAKEYILEDMPPQTRQEIESYLVRMESNPYELINEQVGCDFFNNLVKVARSRLASINDDQASGYLANLVEGIRTKHPELTDFEDWFLPKVLSDEQMRRLSKLDEPDPNATCSFFLEDILLALEQDHLTSYQELEEQTEPMISTNGLKAINQVWENEGAYPLRELIAELEQEGRDQ